APKSAIAGASGTRLSIGGRALAATALAKNGVSLRLAACAVKANSVSANATISADPMLFPPPERGRRRFARSEKRRRGSPLDEATPTRHAARADLPLLGGGMRCSHLMRRAPAHLPSRWRARNVRARPRSATAWRRPPR